MISFQKAKAFESHSFEERYEKYIKFTLEHSSLKGLWLEFGVATGETTNKYLTFMPHELKPLYGFDWFKGLPTKWANHKKGKFSTKGKVPQIKGTEMIVGLFEDTLPKFFENKNEIIAVLIVDCDLYSSTKTIFKYCKEYIRVGTVLIFDEIHNGSGIYPDWQEHEYKAFMEFVEENSIEYEWIAYEKNGEQASCIITKI
jgi:hypothetical protein